MSQSDEDFISEDLQDFVEIYEGIVLYLLG